MNYPEAAYFDGAHVAHIAEWEEHQRLSRIQAVAYRSERIAAMIRRHSQGAWSGEALRG